MKLIKKIYKYNFSKKRAKECYIQTLLRTYKSQKNNFFSQAKEVF